MATILVNWNPGHSDDHVWSSERWEAEMVHRTRDGEAHPGDWSVGQRTQGIASGDRVFLLRQGEHGRGIVARGLVDTEIYPQEHWNAQKAGTANFVDIVWLEALPLDQRVDSAELAARIPEYNWATIFGSGRDVTQFQGELEKLWSEHLRKAGLEALSMDDLVEDVDPASLPEAELIEFVKTLSEQTLRAWLVDDFDFREEDLEELDTHEKLADELVALILEWQAQMSGNPDDVEEIVRGAGFGSAEENRKVDLAAIAAVEKHLGESRYEVVSVEREKCGWDLTGTRGDDVVRAEVKGVSGKAPRFFLTANEMRAAQVESGWVLMLVTEALTAPTVHRLQTEDVISLARPSVYRVDLTHG